MLTDYVLVSFKVVFIYTIFTFCQVKKSLLLIHIYDFA